MRKLHLFLPLLVMTLSCSSQKEQPSTSMSESSDETQRFTVPENTIYKVYPDGTSHLIQEKELNADGNTLIERQYVSRVDEKDSSGYFYSLYHEYRYAYYEDGRLKEKLNYEMGNHDTLILQSKDAYTWKGDTMIHSFAFAKPNGTGFQIFKEEDISVTNADGQIIYRNIHKGLNVINHRDQRIRAMSYVIWKYIYLEGELQSVVIINRDNVHNVEAFGKEVPTDAMLKRTYRPDGQLLSDTVFSVDHNLIIQDAEVWTFNEFNELVTYSACEGNPRENQVFWEVVNERNQNSMFLPPLDLDPMVEVEARKADPREILENWNWKGYSIIKSIYTYENDLIQSRVDEFEATGGAVYPAKREISYIYDDNQYLTEQHIKTVYFNGEIDEEVIDLQRYEGGGLERLIRYVNDTRLEEIHLSPTGMYLDVYRAERKNDSTVRGTFTNYRLSTGYQAEGSAETKNGELVRGKVVLLDEEGRMVRYFAESDGSDALFFYNGYEMTHSEHRKIRYTYFPESMHETDVYELHYGKGYSFGNVMFSPFVPYVSYNY